MNDKIKNTISSSEHPSIKESFPMVSICCITYNHAPFIRQCLDGFLMQKTSFPIEILIHDDCSTDGTTEIVREYASKYPDLIFPLYETENQYSKPNRQPIDFYNYRRARGKYIAYCEGDDYWTDPYKLQKQVDFMEANPEYSICFHGIEINDLRNGKRYTPDYKLNEGQDCDIPSIPFATSYIQPLTILFRMSMFSFEWSKQYHGYRDTHETYHLLRVGKGRFLNFIGGIYNQHNGGISSGIDRLTSCSEEHVHVTELYLHNRNDKELKAYLKSVLLWILNEYHKRGLKSTYRKTLREIWKDTPELWPSIVLNQFKQSIKQVVKR